MPAENTFKKHAELIHKDLKNFLTVCSLNTPGLVNTAITDLINGYSHIQPFYFFLPQPCLVSRTSPAIYNVLKDFAKENPSFVMPKSILR